MPTSFSHIVLRLFTFPLLLLQSLQNPKILLLLPLLLLPYYFATKYFAIDTKFTGVVELTTQLLIPSNILWPPCVESINLGWILYPRKLLRSPILVGYQDLFLVLLPRSIAIFLESLGIYIYWSLWRILRMIEPRSFPLGWGEVRNCYLALHLIRLLF